MFKRFFHKPKSGIFRVENQNLVELDSTPGNGSINSIVKFLGYKPQQVRTIHAFKSESLLCVGVKIFTKDVVFAISKEKQLISNRDIDKLLNSTDWSFEYSSHSVQEILDDGIKENCLSLDFLNSVLDLKRENNDTFFAQSLDLFLTFQNNLLVAYTTSDLFNADSNWLKNLNQEMFKNMLDEASKFHNNDYEASEEVNIQASHLTKIPKGVRNEFIENHRNDYGNINFYNLNIIHYNYPCELNEFKLVNKGRYNEIDSDLYRMGNYLFKFDSNNQLIEVSEK